MSAKILAVHGKSATYGNFHFGQLGTFALQNGQIGRVAKGTKYQKGTNLFVRYFA